MWTLAVLLAMTPVGQLLTDDFSTYAERGEAGPDWDDESAAFEVTEGRYVGKGGTAIWRKAPYAEKLTFSCDVTVLAEEDAANWQTAGIAVWTNDRNHWRLNLVRAPAANGGRHYAEFQEMLDGVWLASHQEDTRLASLVSRGGDFDWQVGRTYRFTIVLSPERIEGRIAGGEQVVAEFAWSLGGGTKAVRAGRPALSANGLRVAFDNAEVEIGSVAEEPQPARPSHPPWVPRDAPRIAEPTGFFEVVQVDGRWWLADPEGKAFYDVGTDHCNYDAHWCEKLGYAPYHRNMVAKYGSADKWAESATARLKDWGFNVLAAGHHPSTEHRGLPHIDFASLGAGFARREWICEPIHWTGFPNVFSPRWERYCRAVARRLAEKNRGDPWCLGTFIDNELEWYGKRGYLVDEIFRLGADHTAKIALWDWLVQRFDPDGVGAALGEGWGTRERFLANTHVPEAGPALNTVRSEFLAVIAEEYFRVAATALREADPDHLVVGCRFAGQAPTEVLPAAGKYNDVFSINTYPRVDLERGVVAGVPRQFTEYYRVVQRPFMVTEWSFPALDAGLPCRHGAGMRVDTQAQKARCYEIFAEMCADLPFMVGYHYFMWVDEPAEGISSTFPEDSNYGLVNVNDEPYVELVTTATRVNRAAFDRHARSAYSGDLTIEWRGNDLAVRNPDDVAGTGSLLLRPVEGEARRETLTLAGGAEQVFVAPTGGWAAAALRRWDGSHLILTRPGTGTRVVNLGQQTVANVPLLLDPPNLVVVGELAPGDAWTPPTPAVEPRPAERFEFAGGGATWTCERRTGALFERVTADGLALGEVIFAAHQVVGGQHQWVSTDRVESLATAEQPTGWVIDAVVAFTGGGQPVLEVDQAGQAAPQRAEPARFRAGLRAAVLRDRPVALVRPLWVESTDPRRWRLEDAFVFCRPAIGGSPEDDAAGGPDVPNYYLPAHFWTDSKLGGAFGAAGGEQWPVHFWKDPGGLFHPDARHPVRQDLAPGERWEAGALSSLWVYATRDAGGWREPALAALAAAELAGL